MLNSSVRSNISLKRWKMAPNIMNKSTFSLLIEQIVIEKECEYIEAIVDCCTEHEIEIESAAKMINEVIKLKIEAEASELNLMKEKKARLPI